jgi:hypothetical protein
MKRFFAVPALALATLAAIGCELTGPLSGLEGDYVLQTINGQTLPHTSTFAGGDFYTVRSYGMRVMRGNQWNYATSYSSSSNGVNVSLGYGKGTGTYTYTPPSNIELVGSEMRFTGTVSGDQLTLALDGDTWLFTRAPDTD